MRSFFFILLWFPVLQGFSQETNRAYDRLGILAGWQQTRLVDQQFSPLMYKANELSFKLYYNAKHHQSNWNVSLEAATGSLFPPQFADRMLYNTTEDIDGNMTTDSFFVRGNTRTVNLQLGYAYDLVHKDAWRFSVGGSVRNQLMYPSTFVNIGIMNSASFLVTTEGTYYAGSKNELSLGINVPVIGFNTRFPYSGTVSTPNQSLLEAFFDGGTHFISFNKYTQVNVNAGWRYALSDGTGIGLQYDFMWQRYTTPVTLKQYSFRIGISVDFVL